MSTEFVLDCSATLPWIFASEATTATDRLLDQISEGAQAWVPSLWYLELGQRAAWGATPTTITAGQKLGQWLDFGPGVIGE